MTQFLRSLLAASLGIVMAAGCAHAPANSKDRAAAVKVAKPEMMIVTGSHIPQRVDPATGLAASTFSPVRVFSRQQLTDTGRQYDNAAALRELDPSLGP